MVPAIAVTGSPCAGAVFSEAVSLSDLPRPIRSLLGVDRPGRDGVADHGGRYSATDALTPLTADLPSRRFSLGALAPQCVLVAVEHGGIAYFSEVWMFELHGTKWMARRLPFETAPPASVEGLVRRAKPAD